MTNQKFLELKKLQDDHDSLVNSHNNDFDVVDYKSNRYYVSFNEFIKQLSRDLKKRKTRDALAENLDVNIDRI